MSSFDYSAPAELFLSKPAKGSRTKYRRFATAAEALRYAVEDLRIPKAFGAWLEVGDERFDSSEIQRLYEARRLCGCHRRAAKIGRRSKFLVLMIPSISLRTRFR
jgi:hypothetical protein